MLETANFKTASTKDHERLITSRWFGRISEVIRSNYFQRGHHIPFTHWLCYRMDRQSHMYTHTTI